MSNKKIRFAILGTGNRWYSMDSIYLSHPNIELVALCDTCEAMLSQAVIRIKEQGFPVPKTYRSYEEMAKDAVYDAVLITLDPTVQVEYAVAEMNRGIHVMTEVPAAYTIKQCYDLVNTVKKTGVKYQLGEQTRYWYFISQWRKMAQEGKFGKIYYAEGAYLHYLAPKDDYYFQNKETGLRVWNADSSYDHDPAYQRTWRYQIAVNPILYLPHELSPLLSIVGGRITKVSCFGTKPGNYVDEGFETRAIETALMYNSNDAIFSLHTGFTVPAYGDRNKTGAHWYQLKGTEMSVEGAHSLIEEPKLYTPSGGWEAHPEWECQDPNVSEEIRNSGHGGVDYYPIHHFTDAILNDTTPPMDVYRAVETAAPAILAAESANKGGIMLEVPDFRKA